jgi:hypothetical protein
MLAAMANSPTARWWSLRRAQNHKPATYRCPLCGKLLPALSEHMLIVPEGRSDRRRHAHSACVLAARRAGKLPTRAEWLRTQPRSPGWWERTWQRLRR